VNGVGNDNALACDATAVADLLIAGGYVATKAAAANQKKSRERVR